MKSIKTLNDDILKRYKNGDSLLSISRDYGCSRQTITRYIKKYNQFIERIKPIQKTNFDMSKIHKMTKEVAYFLGLLWTDGHIRSSNGYVISIKLVIEDTEALKSTFSKIGNFSYYTRKPKNRREVGVISYYNKELYNYLYNLGYKTKSTSSACKVVEKIPENLKKYFFRGIVDGDGHISYRENISYGLNISSTFDQDWKYMFDIYDKLNIKYSTSKSTNKNGKSSSINITNLLDTYKFLNFIYDGYRSDKIGLQRKYDKYLLIEKKSKRYLSP